MRRAGKIEIGETGTGAAVRAGRARLLLLAADASENARKRAEGYLYGEVDPETGAQLSDAFIRVKGKLERSDRGDQIIAQEIEPLVLSEESNRPKVFEIMVPSSRFSQSNMVRLATVLNTNPGGDRVELFIEQADGQTMRAEIPTRVNARSIPLIAEVKGIVGNKGRVTVI